MHTLTHLPDNSSDIITTEYVTYFNHSKIHSTAGLSCSLDYPECTASRYLWIVTSLLMLLLGTFGNTMIIAVMAQRSYRRTGFGCYLMALSIMDLIAIWIALSRHFIKNAFLLDVRDTHEAVCWLQRFLVYGATNSSVWILSAVTLDRTISIYAPTRSIRSKGLGATRLKIVLIVLVQFLWNIQVFFTRGDEYRPDGSLKSHCGYKSSQSKYYWDNIHSYVALVDYSAVPFVAMLTMNAMIIYKLRKRDKRYKKCTNIKDKHNKIKTSSVSSKTLMLLPVTFFFLVTTLPSLAFTGVEESITTYGRDRAKMELADYFVTTLMYLNHCLNFFLYCLTGKVFRIQCWKMLKKWIKRSPQDDSDENEIRSSSTPMISRKYGPLLTVQTNLDNLSDSSAENAQATDVGRQLLE